MDIASRLIIIIFITVALVVIALVLFLIYLLIFDRNQKHHAILRNYPELGRGRYFLEKAGPEFRKYLFNEENEGKPFSRDDLEHIVKSAKYMRGVIVFGSKRDFLKNAFLFGMLCSPN
ncbi:hypothetical protein P4646_05610 [Peribacillus simplex]|uniref:hypothetical protein n=1 Tax=Peribacillus simplex TaxID=1478 RepID=UPI002E1EE80A|nr:hypothetical protein [Peribacillus simplex]MED4096872.1 hypothetical protein [Peribacillus simplex]